jgi:uncharacterized protein with PQ loop repeat
MNLSLIALVISVIATFPQLYSTLQTGRLRDHHPMTAILALIANAILAVHGYLRKDLGILLLGLWFTLYNAVLTYYKVGRDQKDSDDA